MSDGLKHGKHLDDLTIFKERQRGTKQEREARQIAPLIFGLTLKMQDLADVKYVSPDRYEAVLSSQIEGTQSTLEDVLQFEVDQKGDDRVKDVQEVVNYVAAMNHGLKRLPNFPLSLRLIREIHAKLLEGTRGSHRTPGEFRQSQNWIGPKGCTLQTASFVPPPVSEMTDALSNLEKFLHDPSPIGESTPVNRGMIGTLDKEADYFFYYNNGITIVCDRAEKFSRQGRDLLRVNNPQVINGQQTTVTIAGHADKRQPASVLVKVIQVPREENDGDKFDALVCGFRTKVTSRFGNKLPVISEQSYHAFRSKVTTFDG